MHYIGERRNASDIISEARLKTPVHPGSAILRRAVRQNIVSFPSQISALLKHPPADMQRRVVLLFFVRGWSWVDIATRFNVPKHLIRGILNEWSVRALALGCIQVIDPEAFATCCRADDEYGASLDTDRFPNALQSGEGNVQRGLGVHEEEQVSYAVA